MIQSLFIGCSYEGSFTFTTIRSKFTTIQSCVDQLTAPGDECIIPRGGYHERVTVTNKHGTPEKPIIISGIEDEYPIIDGTVQLQPKGGWVKDDSGAFKAVVDQEIWQLFIDGEMMTNARWPNALWSNKTVFNASYWAKSSTLSTRGVMVDDGSKDLAGSGLNATGAMAVLNIGSFNTFTAVVQSHNPGNASFTYRDTFGRIKFFPGANQYFLEDKLEFLDQPEEWFYDKASRTVFVMTGDGKSPEGRDVRGKVMTYAFNITNCSHVVFQTLKFFGTTLWASTIDEENTVNNLTFHSIIFNYPSYTRRMLGDTAPAEWTKMNANTKKITLNTLTVFNNTFLGTDGAALEFSGLDVTLENNLFEYNDWTAANMVYRSGGLGTVISNGIGDIFVRNTLRYNGASSGIRPGLRPTVRLNHLHHQCWGIIQHDGSHVQLQIKSQTHAILQQNWVHSSVKYGVRFDGQPPLPVGRNGTMHSKVVWKCNGMMVKGDNHTVQQNLVFDKRNEKDGDHQGDKCSLCVLRYVRENPVPINNGTVVMFNAADKANGGKHGGELYPLAGSVVKFNVIGNVRDQLVDPDNFDFRPLSNSTYIGHNVGPYSYHPELTNYWIPGRQLFKASTPVPPDHSVKIRPDRRDTLMWLNGYGTSVHRVYFGTDKERVNSASLYSPEYLGSVVDGGNVLHLRTTLEPLTKYFWRVDSVVKSTLVYRGDVWFFKTSRSSLVAVSESKGNNWRSRYSFTSIVTIVTALKLTDY
ncbi:hypothetical protein AWC38_SpisGene8026 [Stylophora pistillata]|uniref:Right handed beta helix domain-containing protein n=1 Tax=Stylophora pistillata TaxID=50429 RepID=A0A2B4SD05_STYPI|nr:hypothetical protein AWC38_SpisGene8026 [Stylophora pistillata]